MSKKDNLANEQELISACIDNNPQAQKILFEMYAGKMLGVCARYCPNLEDAKDALHEGFIKIFKQIDKFNGNSKLQTWMTRIMIFTAIDHFKKSIKFNYYEKDEDIYKATNREISEEVEYDDEQVNINDLYAVINELPEGYKVVFNLYAIDGFTHKQIANKLGISEGTSKSQLARARKLLQKLVKEKLNIGKA
ncbi:MAG: sigma-70 family RNA polymerase sigma factor [Bacteroidia bacterium]|nr:sigma-70 family RNA polymerase sigma factor [Bacteroidia bacterium]NNJ54486.1 sigma-70 family RNA polymerase sigma factor [Bacteroidia bacterium]